MELVVGLVVVVGILFVAARFLVRPGGSGAVRLPQVVDDSIGMWVLRRLSGRPLGDRRAGAASDAARPRGPRPFSAAVARRMGIRSAGEVAPRPVAPAAPPIAAQAAAGQSTGRTGMRGATIGLLVVAAVVVGLAIGTGMALLTPTAGAPATSGPPASPSTSGTVPSAPG